MGIEIDLLKNYPKTKRDPFGRLEAKSESDQAVARKFGQEFFDGDRSVGYGGYNYDPRFWTQVVKDIIEYYNLRPGMSVLDVGCAKGFMLCDFQKQMPGLNIQGVDISDYAITNGHPSVKDKLKVACASSIPFPENSFDLVISITTVHNLEGVQLLDALSEIERVSKRHSFITVDAFRNDVEQKAMEAWNLTAKSILHVDAWKGVFEKAGYTGDYYWFMP